MTPFGLSRRLRRRSVGSAGDKPLLAVDIDGVILLLGVE